MRTLKFALAPIAAVCVAALAMPVVAAEAVSDQTFNDMLGTMAARDTGSARFDNYVETLNQEIAFKQGGESFGAAGPSGPLDGFDGYVSGFRMPDSGSRQFNNYVDRINQVIQEKQRYDY